MVLVIRGSVGVLVYNSGSKLGETEPHYLTRLLFFFFSSFDILIYLMERGGSRFSPTINDVSVSSRSGTMVVSWVSSAFSETLHTTKHVAHVCLLLIVVALFEVGAGGLWGGTPTTAAYPPLVTLLFQLLRLLPLLALPQVR